MLEPRPPTTDSQHGSELSAQVREAPMSELAETGTLLLRVTRDARQLHEWTLVLKSKGLSPLVLQTDGAFELHALSTEVVRASAELDAFDAEELSAARARTADRAIEAPPATRFAAVGSLLVAALLLAFFAVTGPRAAGAAWFSTGASDAAKVLDGEWWRTVTALTLHADGAHVLSNVGIGTLVVGAVMRSEGVGWGAALVLASGAAGNFVNAWAHQSLHRSVGFSTAVFGAIGILGGLAYVRGRRRVNRTRPAWTAIAGSIALLALLGTGGERTDIFAHLFGAACGLAIGIAVARSGVRPRTATGQWLAGVAVAASVVGSWFAALV